MLKLMSGLGALLVASSGAATSARGQSVYGDVGTGEQIAGRECAGCHGAGIPQGVTIRGVYVPSFGEISSRPNQSRERLRSFVHIPRHPMPGIPLSEEEVRHVVEYIWSLKN
jgi:mono/diheme cytochrome c family protein